MPFMPSVVCMKCEQGSGVDPGTIGRQRDVADWWASTSISAPFSGRSDEAVIDIGAVDEETGDRAVIRDAFGKCALTRSRAGAGRVEHRDLALGRAHKAVGRAVRVGSPACDITL